MVGRRAAAGPWGLSGKEPKNGRAEVRIGGGGLRRETKEGTSFIKGLSKTFKWAFQDGKEFSKEELEGRGGTHKQRRKRQEQKIQRQRSTRVCSWNTESSALMRARDTHCGGTRLKRSSGLKGEGFDQGAEVFVTGHGETFKNTEWGSDMIPAVILGNLFRGNEHEELAKRG